MTYKIDLHKRVQKFLDKQSDDFVLRFFTKAKLLAKDPYHTDIDIKPLQGAEKGSYRLRLGKYRFKYTVIEHTIVIYFYDADSRGDIY